MSDTAYLNRDDAARTLRIHRNSLDRLRKRSEGPPFLRLGHRIVYSRQSLDEWTRTSQQQ